MVKYREILRLAAMGGEPEQHRLLVRMRAVDGVGRPAGREGAPAAAAAAR